MVPRGNNLSMRRISENKNTADIPEEILEEIGEGITVGTSGEIFRGNTA